MLHIQIIQVGKTKDKYFKEAEDEFLKRLSRYAKIEIDTVPEKGTYDDLQRVVKEEGEKILQRLRDDTFVIVLDIKGEQYTSEKFAEVLKKVGVRGKVTFIIGGPYGLSQNVLKRADLKLSLSKMTFTHQMVRIFLLEQLYRGFTILAGKKYHY